MQNDGHSSGAGNVASKGNLRRPRESYTMDATQNHSVIECAETMVTSIDAATSLFREIATRKRDPKDSNVVGAVKTVEDHAKKLHALVNKMSSQRVLILSANRLMEAGIVLYNSARTAFKSYQATLDNTTTDDPAKARFPLLHVRFMAARVMGLALSCSTGGAKDVSGNGVRDQSVFVEDCLDVLRSYGRVGSLLMETAAADSEKCFDYLTLAKEALDYANSIWGQVGLSCLTRFKDGIELEEILQDLWDICVDRIRTVRLSQCYTNDSTAVTVIIETLHELQMLLPYMMGNTKTLLELVQNAIEEWNTNDRQSDLVILAEEALRLCDAVETTQDIAVESCVPAFKLRFLQRLLESLVSLGEVEKSEACFALLGPEKDTSTLLSMIKLYLQNQEDEKAMMMLKYLFQRDDIGGSISGARMFAEAHSFNADSIQIYRQLERHYGDHVLDIRLDLGCALAMSDSPHNRASGAEEMKSIGEMIADLPSESQSMFKSQVTRMIRVIHDAAGAALNSSAHEECTTWAELGIQHATSTQEVAVFKRMMAAAYLKLNRTSESRQWAMEALQTDSSKASLLSVFEASLGIDDESRGCALDILQQLKGREDFEPEDLLSYGYAASCAGQEGVTLMIMDDLCCFVRDLGIRFEDLPIGVLIQNTAQLALQVTTTRSDDTSDNPTSYAKCFAKYTDMFLQAAEELDVSEIDRFAPEAAFVWFYTMSFNVARSCTIGSLFVRAADIAKQAQRIFGDSCAISGRELECLLASLSTEITCLDTTERSHSRDVLAIVARIKPLCEPESTYDDFLVKCELAIRLRMLDTDVERMKNLCHDKMQKDVSSFVEVGELILHSSSFDEAAEVRRSYRSLASEMFKRGLQLLLQGENVDQEQLSYLFRRLIMLAESREASLEWFEQLIQLQASVDIQFPELDAEWFIAKAWNMGVQYHRCQSYAESQKFMKVALALLANIGSSLTELTKALHKQYQDLCLLGNESILTID